jgi:hypothetical protein
MRPFSGEPDVGQYKVPPSKGVLVQAPDPGLGGRTGAWSVFERLQWIGRIWMARYLGAR